MLKRAYLAACIIALLIYALPYARWLALDPDSFWHLRTGAEILHTADPALPDRFSHTAARHAWVNHEWFADLLYAVSFKYLGEPGLLLLRGGIFAATLIALLLLLCRMGASAAVSLLLVSQIARPLVAHFSILSPYTITNLWVLLLLHLLHRTRPLPPLLLALLFMSWANVHAGFAFGLVIVGIHSFEEWRKGKALSTALAPFAVACLASLLTPFHINLWVAIAREMTFSHTGIPEWQSLNFSQLMIWLVLVLPACLGVFASPRAIPVQLIGGFMVAAVLCLQHQRFLAILAVFSLLLVSTALSRWRTGVTNYKRAFALCVLLIAFVESARGLWTSHQQPFGVFVDKQRYPLHAVLALPEASTPLPVAADFDWGGFLIYTRGPQITVHIDGRGPWVYLPNYLEQVLAAEAVGDIRRFLAGQQPALVMVRTGSPLHAAFMAAVPEWRELFRDSTATIFGDGARQHFAFVKHSPSPSQERFVPLSTIPSAQP